MRFRVWIGLTAVLGPAFASSPPARGQVLRQVELQRLAAERVEAPWYTPDELSRSLPTYARYLDTGNLAIRGRLLSIQPAASEPPGRSAILDDLVYSFRVLEVFFWREERFLPRSAMPADSLLRFRIAKNFVKSNIEARSHGRTSPIVLGQEYWVKVTSQKLREAGEFALGGVLPIRDGGIVIQYSELERTAEGEVTSWPAELNLPLARYRECLGSRAFIPSVVAALAESRGDPNRRAACEFDDYSGRPGDHFRVGPRSTREDSLRALDLERPPGADGCRVLLTVEAIGEPVLDSLPFYQTANRGERSIYQHELALLAVRVESVLRGDCAEGPLAVYTLLPTPNRGADIAGEAPRQRICPGSRLVASIQVRPDQFDGQALLHAPYFVFGIPGTEAYRGDLIDPVLALYRSAR